MRWERGGEGWRGAEGLATFLTGRLFAPRLAHPLGLALLSLGVFSDALRINAEAVQLTRDIRSYGMVLPTTTVGFATNNHQEAMILKLGTTAPSSAEYQPQSPLCHHAQPGPSLQYSLAARVLAKCRLVFREER